MTARLPLPARLAVGLALLPLLAATARAQPPGARIDCNDPRTTPEIAWCAGKDFEAADAELNAVYKQALAGIGQASHLGPEQRRDWTRALREAQRHWLAFRDKDCGEVVGWEWYQGTGMGAASLGCKTQKTRTRTEELKERYVAR